MRTVYVLCEHELSGSPLVVGSTLEAVQEWARDTLEGDKLNWKLTHKNHGVWMAFSKKCNNNLVIYLCNFKEGPNYDEM